MSNHEPPILDLKEWISEAGSDRLKLAQREVTAIILNAVATEDDLRASLILKGGTLLAVAHGSSRQTTDIDFTSKDDPEAFAETFPDRMNKALDRARSRLGYANLRCRVQGKLHRQPRNFAADKFPSIAANIAYARVGSPAEKRLNNGQCSEIVEVEISFREPIVDTHEVKLLAGNASLEVYSVNEVLAEKFRAYLQQSIRNRRRRQDIYDIAFLLNKHGEAEVDRGVVMKALREKCASHSVPLAPELIDDSALIERARHDWSSMALEIGDLPPFEECFSVARVFYLSLPWHERADQSSL